MTGVATREATKADNQALLDLTAACPMQGDISLCVNREPDFFALNRLEGDVWRVGVVDGTSGSIAGCIAVTQRTNYLFGHPEHTIYVSDIKVHPSYRGQGISDALLRYAQEHSRAACGAEVPMMATILAGNRPMERLALGPRGLPKFTRFATIRSYSVGLLWKRRSPKSGFVTISHGEARDIEEMAALWRRLAPSRQFTPVYDAESLAQWIEAAPALNLSSYWLARRPDGRLAGFLGLWDQASFKQMRVTGYSRQLAAFRIVFNWIAPLLGAGRLPPAGEALRYLTAVHVCVPAEEPDILRSLLVHAHNELRRSGYSFFTIGLDVHDPLTAALNSLLTQRIDSYAYVTSPTGQYQGPKLDDRPIHYEIALV